MPETSGTVELRDALRSVSKDMHNTSTRPCSTCRLITEVMGEPFGCYAYHAELAARVAARTGR